MIDPIIAVAALLAFVLTAAAVLLARRAGAPPRQRPKTQRAAEAKPRYLNGGWH